MLQGDTEHKSVRVVTLELLTVFIGSQELSGSGHVTIGLLDLKPRQLFVKMSGRLMRWQSKESRSETQLDEYLLAIPKNFESRLWMRYSVKHLLWLGHLSLIQRLLL